MRHIRQRRNSKEKNQRYHSKIRALQHFGQQLTNLDLEKMAEIYRHSFDTRLLKKQTCRLMKAIITYNDNVYPIIYDKKRHQIVTILKPDYLNEKERMVYDACYARMLLEKKRTGERVVPAFVHDIDVKIKVTDRTTSDDSAYLKHEEAVDDKCSGNEYVMLPTEKEGKTIMEEVMT